jgi:hypothetical protein
MEKKAIFVSTILLASLLVFASLSVFAQKRKPSTTPKKTPVSAQPKTETPEIVPAVEPPTKKNERPENAQEVVNKRPSTPETAAGKPFVPAYHYEFTQPEFVVSKIIIEHDEGGKGKISFAKKGDDDLISDPIQLSDKTLEKITEILGALNFLASNENYQYEKDFSHLGTIIFRLTRDGKTRSTTFNWTQNKDAKLLMDEYRKISNQFIWMFDISLARENQPLESPNLMDSLASMIRRNEISDPKQMAPFLQSLINDERMPLIARNHAGKLVKQLEKEKK